MNENKKIKVGISKIRSARRGYIEDFWNVFSTVLEIDFVVSDLDIMSSYEKGKHFYGSSNAFCMFRCLDAGQHIDLIERGCNCLILLSQRETGKRACSTENYIGEHLSVKYPDIEIINFFLHSDSRLLQIEEINRLCNYFTDDKNKINKIIDAWPSKIIDGNRYLNHKKNRINLLIIGDMYYFLNPRMQNSLYVDFLQDKLNCNIITPTDYEERGLANYKNAYKQAQKLVPVLNSNFEHYWKKIKRLHIIDVLVSEKDNIDGVLIVSDIWCEMFKEEIPCVIKLLEELNIPYYNLVFNLNSLSTIETILESFVETLVDRRKKNESLRH